MHKSIILITTVFFLLSCYKEPTEVILYQTSFEKESDLSGFSVLMDNMVIPLTEVATATITEDEKRSGNSCLLVNGPCFSSIARSIGPLDADYEVRVEVWIKTDFVVEVQLAVFRPEYADVTFTTSESLQEALNWNVFNEGSLRLKEGQSFSLIIDPCDGIVEANSWIDDIKVIGIAP